jgi:gliding motility-associated-like protein
LKTLIALIFVLASLRCFAQPPAIEVTVHTQPEICTRGFAQLSLTGLHNNDSTSLEWSTGERNVTQVTQLSEGSYSIRIYVKRRQDTLVFVRDTTIWFSVGKERCPVIVPKYFTPNGDAYNDVLVISNVDYYPDFEFEVFNKAGQRVHRQRKEYTAWDGSWLGIPLPDATYYFVFFYDVKDRKNFVQGDITILK